jgi:hypothetical protein
MPRARKAPTAKVDERNRQTNSDSLIFGVLLKLVQQIHLALMTGFIMPAVNYSDYQRPASLRSLFHWFASD